MVTRGRELLLKHCDVCHRKFPRMGVYIFLFSSWFTRSHAQLVPYSVIQWLWLRTLKRNFFQHRKQALPFVRVTFLTRLHLLLFFVKTAGHELWTLCNISGVHWFCTTKFSCIIIYVALIWEITSILVTTVLSSHWDSDTDMLNIKHFTRYFCKMSVVNCNRPDPLEE